MFNWTDFFLFCVSFLVCFLNKKYHFCCRNFYFDYFLRCYFNDFIGSIGFTAFCDFLLRFCRKSLDRYWKVLLLMLFCGFVWEVITPIFRSDTVGDWLDVVSYIAGGSLFYCILLLRNHWIVSKQREKSNH